MARGFYVIVAGREPEMLYYQSTRSKIYLNLLRPYTYQTTEGHQIRQIDVFLTIAKAKVVAAYRKS